MTTKLTHTLLALAATGLLQPALAADDHGHDHGASPAPTGPALPRFTAVSDTFELVGVLQGRQLTVYLDRFADNAPVTDAKVELDIGGTKVPAPPHADGAYEVTLAEDLAPGLIAVTATVVAGPDTDILVGELDLHEAAHTAEPGTPPWRRYVPWTLGALALAAALAWAARRMATSRTGGAA